MHGASAVPRRNPEFDHAVITTGVRMDAAADLYRRLGFTLTPRGFHTLGSINHLVVLGRTYAELLGLPPETPDARPEIRDAPDGLDALVFRSHDAEATRSAAAARGAPVGPVQQFSRPVGIGVDSRDAVFRTVRTAPGCAQAGRLYFCEHLTPQLVWHVPWQSHPNGALELVGARVRVADVAREERLYRSLLGDAAIERRAGGFTARADPVAIEVDAGPGQPRMTGLTVRVADPARLPPLLEEGGIAFSREGDAIRVPAAHAWNLELCFE